MAYQKESNSKWETALGEGLVWACITFTASLVLFLIIAGLSEACGVEILFLPYLYYPSYRIAEYLIARQILCNENVFGFLLIAVSAPWMITGFMLGIGRAIFFKPSAMSENDGCLKASFYVVLAVLIGVALIFVF